MPLMKKVSLLIFSFAVCCSQFAIATTVGFSPVPSARTVVDASGAIIGTSSVVWVGDFTSEVFNFNPLLSISANVNAITLAGGWKQFTLDSQTGTANSGVTGALAINAAGKLSGSVTDPNTGPTQAGYFDNHRNLYVWVFNAATVSASTQMGIFRSPDAGSTGWLFPLTSDIGSTPLSNSPSGAPTVVATGSVGSTSSTQLALIASTVPEPSVLALGSMSLVGLLASRKRGLKK